MPNRERITVSLPADLIQKVKSLQPETISDLSASRKFEFVLAKGLRNIK